MTSLQPLPEEMRQFLDSLADADLQKLAAWFAVGQGGMQQWNTDNAKGFQVRVEGGTAYIGDHYSIDADLLEQVLEKLLRDRQLPMVGTPQNLPYSGVTQFVGRDDELNRLHEQLQPGSPVAISAVSGMGGIGKTELALQYAREHCRQGSYPGGLCWLRAREDVGTQIISFVRSCLELTPPDDLELVEKVRWCWGRWREGAVLLIFDDVQHYEDIAPFLPPQDSRFKVLLTTRSHFGSSMQEIQLEVLSEEKAIELLRALVDRDRPDLGGFQNLRGLDTAKQICQWLGYLPLGIELVGRYLARKPDTSLETLWQRLQAKRLDAIAFKQAEPGMTASLGVAAAFELSWQELDESAQQVAAVLSLFALVEIPWTLVEQCLPEVDAEELEEIRDRSLRGANLLKRVDQGMYQLHQLLREFYAVKRSQRADEADLQQQFYQVVIAEAERVREKPERPLIKESTVMITHLQAVIERLDRPEQGLEAATCLYWAANLYYAQGRYTEAEALYLRSLAIREQQLGDDHPDVAENLNELASLYMFYGHYGEAEPLCLRSLEIWRRQLGDDHPNTAESLNNLAFLYRSQGRYKEAEPLYLRSLAIREQQLGDAHPDIAQSLNNLASLYEHQGRYKEAEPLHLQALEIFQRQLGDAHPYVATSLNNLAFLYTSQGRYKEAEPLYLRSLDIRQRHLGADHLNVAQSLNNLARLYRSQARYSDAEPLFLRSLSIRQNQLPTGHPRTAGALSDLAHLYDLQGRYRESEALYLQALPILSAKLEESHPWRQEASNNFRSLLQKTIHEHCTDELSDDPMTQDLLRQLREENNDA